MAAAGCREAPLLERPPFDFDAAPRIEPPEHWSIPAAHAGRFGVVDVVAFHEGDWPEKFTRRAVGGLPVAAGRAAAPGHGEPTMPPLPCPTCGSPYAWQMLGDTAGESLRCCECVAIPSRRMLVGLWVLESRAGPMWVPWQPQRWNPFAHIEAAELAELAATPMEEF